MKTSAVIYCTFFNSESLSFVLQYLDDEGDRVLLATDNDLVGAVNHAKLAGWKVFLLLILLLYEAYIYLSHL